MLADRTKPLPAPEGMKWVVYKSLISGWPYELGLVAERVEVDDRGFFWAGEKRGWVRQSAYIRDERDIRRASKKVLKEYAAVDAKKSALAYLRELVR